MANNIFIFNCRIYFFLILLETAETEGFFWGVIQPFLDGSADSIVKISIETEDGLNINEKLTPLSSFFDGRKPVVDRILLCNDCKKDTDYIYEYNNNCLIKCPENFKYDVDTKHCLEDCNENQITFDNMCYNEFPENSSDFFKGGSIIIKNTYKTN